VYTIAYYYCLQVAQFPKFDITSEGELIGKGSYGIVHKVLIHDKTFATKQIDPELTSAVQEIEPNLLIDLRRYALQECILLSELDHPHIVSFKGVCLTDDNVTLVMEYLPRCLTSVLEKYPNIPPPFKFSILRDACLGLEYLHTYRPPLIHCDISSNNIMLAADMSAKLVDIGSARQVGCTKPDGAMSPCPGALVCMPPEALREHANYDEKLDIFSMGNVILHVITQKWPIPSEEAVKGRAEDGCIYNDPEVKLRHPYIMEMGEDHSLADIVVRCLQSDPQARPEAEDIVANLEQLCAKYPRDVMSVLELMEKAVSNQLNAAASPARNQPIDPSIAQYLVSDLRLHTIRAQAAIKAQEPKNVNEVQAGMLFQLYRLWLQTPFYPKFKVVVYHE
jgi:serine/threonine protein kinase